MSDRELLLFAVGDRRFALPLADVVEIVRMPSLTALPKPLPIVEGIVNVRGRIAAVLDIRKRFDLAAKSAGPSDHLIVARIDPRLVGLRVDRALDVIALAPDQVEGPGGLAPHDPYVAGVAKLPDGATVIHDLRTFLSRTEAEELDRAVTLEPSP